MIIRKAPKKEPETADEVQQSHPDEWHPDEIYEAFLSELKDTTIPISALLRGQYATSILRATRENKFFVCQLISQWFASEAKIAHCRQSAGYFAGMVGLLQKIDKGAGAHEDFSVPAYSADSHSDVFGQLSVIAVSVARKFKLKPALV